METFFLTGTDEHGINIFRAAEAAGVTPHTHVDLIAREFVDAFNDFEVNSYDLFMRTTSEKHQRGAQEFWKRIAAGITPKGNPNVYKGKYEGWFCAPCAVFKTEDERDTRGSGSKPRCIEHERELEKVEEESYFFRLSDYQEWLISEIEANPNRLQPTARRNEVTSFIKGGLQDLSISRERRSVSWGIPVPGDSDHVMYVWIDALSNYLTGIGFGSEDENDFNRLWSGVIHLVGKDILRFHTVYWWPLLKAAGIALPNLVFAHGMWLDAKGRKMSKTLGNAVELSELKSRFSNEEIRYFLLREITFGEDGNFSLDALVDRCNAELANGLGNLAARTVSMISKYREGIVPNHKTSEDVRFLDEGLMSHKEFITVLEAEKQNFNELITDLNLSGALEAVSRMVRMADLMISEAKPWNLAKDPQKAELLDGVLFRAFEALRWICVLLNPILPHGTEHIWKQLGLDGAASGVSPDSLKYAGGTISGRCEVGDVAYPRIEKEKAMGDDVTKTANQGDLAEKAEQAEQNFITIDDFLKVDLRVGEVRIAERIPDADKLLRLEIDIGEGKPRQVLAGLAEYYSPESLVGRRVVVVANLKARKMRGLESQGMICAASLEGGTESPALASFLESVEIGARLK